MISRTDSFNRNSAPRHVAIAALLMLSATVGAAQFLPRSASLAAAPRPAPKATAAQQQRGQQVTAALTRFLRKKVTSPSGQLQIVVRPSPRADAGVFSEIYVAGRPAKVKRLQVSELSMRARNVRLSVPDLMNNKDRSIRTFSSQTTLRAVITEKDLEKMLAEGKSTKEMGLRVKYLKDRLQVAGNVNYSVLNGPVVGTGKLRLAADGKIYLDIISLKLNGAEAPPFIKQRFSQRINPLISYEELPFKPQFKSLKFLGNKAILTA